MAECEGFNAIKNRFRGLSLEEETGHRGLENPGSTCYLNSVLQTLFMTEEFREHVKRLHRYDVSSDGNFIKELQDLFNELKEQKKTAVSAAGIRKSLNITDVRKQGDAAEILHLIIKTLIKKTPEYSKFFKGSINTTRTCGCRDERHYSEDFLSLIVSFEEYQDVEDAVQELVDKMCGMNWENCSCHEFTVWGSLSFPKILIVQLRRFKADSSGYSKNDLIVNIRPHIKVSFHKYDLYAIINHSGTYQGGHYYADIKCEDETWRRFDDDCVSESPINSIFVNKSFTLRSSKAYLLVYRRREGAVSITLFHCISKRESVTA